jgi:hypothetical protein
MIIYIPTYMREDKQVAFNSLPENIRPFVSLVTHSGRADLLKEANPKAAVVDLGPCDGIADVRQKLLDQAPEDKVFIIDDQCRFKKRNADMKYELMTEADFRTMFELVDDYLDTYSMVGISDRGGNNRLLEATKEIARMYSVYGINKVAWSDLGVSFDGMYQKDNSIKLYEDFYAILSLLTKGEPNLLICDYVFESKHGAAGGNSTFRNNATQKSCIEALQREFPQFVSIDRKTDASWTTESGDTDRWEARVAWKDAFLSGSSTGSLSEFF